MHVEWGSQHMTQNSAEEWFELTALIAWQLTEAGRAIRSRCREAW